MLEDDIQSTDASILVKKNDYDTKISEIEKKKQMIMIMVNILLLKKLTN